MKLIKRLIVIILIVAAFWMGGTYYKANDMYHKAIEQMPIDEKVMELQSMDNYVSYSQLTETYTDAVIAVEDCRFLYHKGVDPISMVRAIVGNIKSGGLYQGGSTITQQLARHMYFEQDKDFARKLAEMFVAIDIEKEYDKNEIREMYVNIIYFGSGYTGIYDASMGYFSKKPAQLNDYESTMLAGIPQAPSVYSLDANPELAEQRRQQVITCMIENDYIEEGEIE